MALTTVRFRPMFGRILTIVIVVLGLVGLIGFAASGDWLGLARNFGTISFIAVMVWAIFWRPELVVEESGVSVVNVFATHHVPWPAIQRIDTRYTLTIYTPNGKIAVWASPAPGRHGAAAVTRGDLTHISGPAHGQGDSLRPSDALSTESGQAAHVMRLHWERLRDDGHLDNPVIEPGSLRRDWHWRTIVALAALLLVGIILPFI